MHARVRLGVRQFHLVKWMKHSYTSILVTNSLKKLVFGVGLGSVTAVCNHWTGPLDWTTGLDYWTDLKLAPRPV